MTIKSSLTRCSLSPSAPAAVHLLTRQSVIPLSRAAFVKPPELLLRGDAETIALMAGLKQIDPAAGK